jgi:flavorubredoxin/flavin reductase (DIM6/NTAB) family NADH-FMN oxidoreductase RutF
VTLRAARAGAGGAGGSGGAKTSGAVSAAAAAASPSASAAGSGRLRLLPAPTPRWPDLLLVFDTETKVLFTGKLFSAHVSPKVAAGGGSEAGEAAAEGADSGDSGGFDSYGKDWKHFYECMLSPVNSQATALLDRLDLRAAATGGGGSGSSGSGGGSSSGGGAPAPSLDEVTSSSPLAAALRALEDALSDLQRSAFGAGAMGAGPSEAAGARGGLAVAAVAPMHGPVVSRSLPQLLQSYRDWSRAAALASSRATVAVFYASAYGNTAALAQAIARGATKAGVGAEAVNLEDAPLSEVEAALRRCSGFAIGSPTLGGHMPTQVTTALGALLRAPAAQRESKPCGAFGSFGWSGEAVDELERKLRDGGYRAAFPAVRVKFRPTAADMQTAEESGTDLAQAVLARAAAREREAGRAAAAAAGASSGAAASADLSSSPSSKASSPSSSSSSPSSSAVLAAELAVGRVVGTLCVVTAGRVPSDEEGGGAGAEDAGGAGEGQAGGSAADAAVADAAAPALPAPSAPSSSASSAMLASWISQASFDPPGLTVAVKRDRAAEPFLVPGARFAVNVLAEGPAARAASKAMLRPFAPGEDRFAGWCDAAEVWRGEQSGATILPARFLASWLECEAVDRMEAGDHWVVYASVLSGGLGGEGAGEGAGAGAGQGTRKGGKGASAANDVLSAVHHRKSGGTY